MFLKTYRPIHLFLNFKFTAKQLPECMKHMEQLSKQDAACLGLDSYAPVPGRLRPAHYCNFSLSQHIMAMSVG